MCGWAAQSAGIHRMLPEAAEFPQGVPRNGRTVAASEWLIHASNVCLVDGGGGAYLPALTPNESRTGSGFGGVIPITTERAAMSETTAATSSAAAVTPEAMLEHWQGHRRLTRRVIEAFPQDQLFTFSLGGMRPFGELAMEMLSMAAPMVRGVVSGDWNTSWDRDPLPKEEILRRWDAATDEINTLWAQIPGERFQENMVAFGQYPGRASDLILYVIDNEIHHRGQGYVYLRALGVEPPPFYER